MSSRIDFQVAEQAIIVLAVVAAADNGRPGIPSHTRGRNLGDGQFLVEAPEGSLRITYDADVPRPDGERPYPERPSPDRSSPHPPSSERPPAEQPSNDRPSNEPPSDGQPSDKRPSNESPSAEQRSTERLSDEPSPAERTSNQRSSIQRPSTELEEIVAMRPSRYCPSDRLSGYAESRFIRYTAKTDRVRAICDYVNRHLIYEAGVSDAHTDAADTLLSGRGVCRDYAHLVATLCRAVDVPARVASVYAPGLSPMDFHLVVETALDGRWQVWDATRLAPRQSLVRIATGRDAADVAFATVLSGRADLTSLEITAVAEGNLPIDDHEGLVTLA